MTMHEKLTIDIRFKWDKTTKKQTLKEEAYQMRIKHKCQIFEDDRADQGKNYEYLTMYINKANLNISSNSF